jgi:hypothetical protein
MATFRSLKKSVEDSPETESPVFGLKQKMKQTIDSAPPSTEGFYSVKSVARKIAADQAAASEKAKEEGKVGTSLPTTFSRLTSSDIEKEQNKVGMKKGGKVSSASKRADGVATKGKTRGRML